MAADTNVICWKLIDMEGTNGIAVKVPASYRTRKFALRQRNPWLGLVLACFLSLGVGGIQATELDLQASLCQEQASLTSASARTGSETPTTLADVLGTLRTSDDRHTKLSLSSPKMPDSTEHSGSFSDTDLDPSSPPKRTTLVQLLDPVARLVPPKTQQEPTKGDRAPLPFAKPSQGEHEEQDEPLPSTKTPVPVPASTTVPDTQSTRIPFEEQPPAITRAMVGLKADLEQTLRFYFDKPLNADDDSPWSVMHSMLGYGKNGPLLTAASRGKRVNVVQWLCQNQPCAGNRLLYIDDQGLIRGRSGPGFEGHPGQFLAMLAQTGLPATNPLSVAGRSLKIGDLIRAEQLTCKVDMELTFKLLSLAIYLEPEATWNDQQGGTWDVSRLLAIEMSQPVNGVACGGTHRIMACSVAVRQRMIQELPLDGVYARGAQYVRDYQRYAISLQNRDGSLSSDWFRQRAAWGDIDRQLQTTGHILEWLVYSLPRNELSDPRIVKTVSFLTDLMTKNRHHKWEVGPRGHALRALSLYHQRVFTTAPVPMANRPPGSQSK